MPTANAGHPDPSVLMAHGPTLQVQIGFDPGWSSRSGVLPQLPLTRHPALVDTGASGHGSIDSAFAEDLGLPLVDETTESGVGGIQTFNVYVAQVYVPELRHLVYGRFTGHHLSQGGFHHRALIGRRFLENYRMVYDGVTGSVTITSD